MLESPRDRPEANIPAVFGADGAGWAAGVVDVVVLMS